MEWNKFLDEQLEDAKVVYVHTNNNLGNFGRFNDWDLSNSRQNYDFKEEEKEEEEEKKTPEERKRAIDTTFNKFNFPTQQILVDTC